MTTKYFNLNTRHIPKDKVTQVGILDGNKNISTTWILDNKLPSNELSKLKQEIRQFCNTNNLTMTETYPYHLQISGISNNLSKAFQTEFHQFNDNGYQYHAIKNDISLPINWSSKVVNILGLNTNKIASPRYIKKENLGSSVRLTPNATSSTSTYFYPPQVATLYNFPTGLNGSGQKVGIIEIRRWIFNSRYNIIFTIIKYKYNSKFNKCISRWSCK